MHSCAEMGIIFLIFREGNVMGKVALALFFSDQVSDWTCHEILAAPKVDYLVGTCCLCSFLRLFKFCHH